MSEERKAILIKISRCFKGTCFTTGVNAQNDLSIIFRDNNLDKMKVLKQLFDIWDSSVSSDKELEGIYVENVSITGPQTIDLDNVKQENCYIITLHLNFFIDKALGLLKGVT